MIDGNTTREWPGNPLSSVPLLSTKRSLTNGSQVHLSTNAHLMKPIFKDLFQEQKNSKSKISFPNTSLEKIHTCQMWFIAEKCIDPKFK